LLVGTASPFFWTHVIFGLLLPLFLVTNASTKSMAGLIGGLALLGVLANKLWLLVAGQEKPWLDFPSGSYFPNWVEFVTMIGALAVGGLIYFLLLNLFQAKEVRGETVEKAV
jgi:molybdopterin-containing oxidoreductase family membrane subunit